MLGPNTSTPPVRQDARTPDWALPGAQEFVPGRLDPSAIVSRLLAAKTTKTHIADSLRDSKHTMPMTIELRTSRPSTRSNIN